MELQIGGLNGPINTGLSAGFSRDIVLLENANLTIDVNCTFEFADAFDGTEKGQALISIDGTFLTAANGDPFMVEFVGNDGLDHTFNFETVTMQSTLLTNGTHEIAVGAYLSRKNKPDETVEMFIHSVTIKTQY